MEQHSMAAEFQGEPVSEGDYQWRLAAAQSTLRIGHAVARPARVEDVRHHRSLHVRLSRSGGSAEEEDAPAQGNSSLRSERALRGASDQWLPLSSGYVC